MKQLYELIHLQFINIHNIEKKLYVKIIMCVKFIINFKKMPSLINFTSHMNYTKKISSDSVPIQF